MWRSEYYSSLSNDIKFRYEKKIEIINGIDPYTLGAGEVAEMSANLTCFPEITTMDLVNYLILTHSFYTGQQLKAYKSLQAYKFYEAGFVQEVFWKKVNEDAYVVIGKVFASMLAATVHCRHLMVWKIFAPKFIFEAVGMFVTLISVMIGYLIVVRINKKVENLIITLNKFN